MDPGSLDETLTFHNRINSPIGNMGVQEKVDGNSSDMLSAIARLSFRVASLPYKTICDIFAATHLRCADVAELICQHQQLKEMRLLIHVCHHISLRFIDVTSSIICTRIFHLTFRMQIYNSSCPFYLSIVPKLPILIKPNHEVECHVTFQPDTTGFFAAVIEISTKFPQPRWVERRSP